MKIDNNLKIILASKSPRRQILLKQIGLDFTIIPSNVDEDLSIKLKPKEFVKHYAKKKARAVSKKNSSSLVIGADTIVSIKNRILGKPNSRKESFEMLRSLSGKTHTVFTGVSIQKKDEKINATFFDSTNVTFKNLLDEEIDYYIKKYKPFDKAGSYGIQDWFSVCIKKIEGCYFNVVGLPLNKFYENFTKCINSSKFKT